ncbi:DNA methyltransferase [Haemophilus influenzae]|uniref:DNA methyltransferase n=1 Tax=Haemophilus influenzae TaxID=727 RepID=UPI0039C88CCC
MQEMYDNGLIVKKKNSLLQKYYKSKAEGSKQTITTWWDEGLLTSNASSDLNKMFKENLFNNPKNESLMELIIEITTNESDIVLDYHLGSGTTAAVAHKMNRQYIGIEQMDYIETLAVERLKKVIKGDKGGISKAVNWQGGGEFVYAELAPFNETAKQQILACESLDDIKTLFNELCERYFLKYNVSVNEFSQIIEEPEFQSLPLDEQKQMVLKMLDLNQMYVSLSEMDDEQFAGCLNDDDKALSRAFYQSVKHQAEKKDGE